VTTFRPGLASDCLALPTACAVGYRSIVGFADLWPLEFDRESQRSGISL